MAAPIVVPGASILTADDAELRVLAAGIVAAVLATLDQHADHPADPARRHPAAGAGASRGFTPLVEYARVRNGSGLTSMDADGGARSSGHGDQCWSLRGEIISLAHFRANLAQLLLFDQRTILPCTRQDWDAAAICAHNRRWASDELASGCKCDVPERTSTV